MQFSADLRERVADGTITVSYRLWSRPKVKVGGVYRSGSAALRSTRWSCCRFRRSQTRISRRTGDPDLQTLRERTADVGPVDDDTLVYRVEFDVVR